MFSPAKRFRGVCRGGQVTGSGVNRLISFIFSCKIGIALVEYLLAYFLEVYMVRILADSTCDLSPELVKRYDIQILPLLVHLGEEEYRDGVDITPEAIYRWSDEHRSTPKTSAVAEPDIEAAISKFPPEDEAIMFSISGQMSTTENVMRLAVEALGVEDRVHVIDSQNLSTGIGLLVVEAAVLAAQGASAGEIVRRIEELRPLVRASFVVDTLVFLYRGGRCSGLAAMAGAALKLHPRIAVVNGAMQAGKKYRGKLSHVILSYVKDMEKDLLQARPERVFITHSGCDPETVEQVRQYLRGLNHFQEILETRAGSVVSSHCGPGTLGVLFIAGE